MIPKKMAIFKWLTLSKGPSLRPSSSLRLRSGCRLRSAPMAMAMGLGKFPKHAPKARVFLLLLMGLLLVSCGAPRDAVAKVGKTPIQVQEFEEADQIARAVLPRETYTDPEDEQKASRARQKQVLQMLVWEAMIREDASNKGMDVEKPYQDLWNKTLDEFGDLKSLEVQLRSLGISEVSFKNSLRRQAMVETHRKKIAKVLAPSKEDLEKFYQKNQEKCALISYIQVSLPTRAEAQDLAKSWKKDPSSIPDSEAKYNGDLFENTRYDQFSSVGLNDPRLADPEIFKQEKESVNWYYSNDLYYVIYVNDRRTAFSEVEPQVRTLYEEDAYLKYMKNLAGKLHVHLYEKNLPPVQEADGESSSMDSDNP